MNRLQPLTHDQLLKLHNACMATLNKVGVVFHDEAALNLFKHHGFKVAGEKVYFSEAQVQKALATVPSEFTIQARNPEKSIVIGGDHFAFGPGWGASLVIDAQGQRRRAQMADQEQFCKLIQTSPYLDLVAGSMAVPDELPPEIATAQMLAACFTLTDMPVVANPCSPANGREIIEMAAMVWGSEAAVRRTPVSIVSVNPLSPLAYTNEAASGLMAFAAYGQALLISSMLLAGISGPITIAGSAVIEMSESLAGIILAQLVNPGVPCVCGGTSCAADLRTGGVALGGPEMLQFMAISTQLARHYGIPCRYGGNLTDAYSLNLQAGAESALALSASLLSGVHFVHQACGIMGAYSAVSFEKFVWDEELCGLIKRALVPVEITDASIGLDLIERIGSGGNYMSADETVAACRTAFFPSRLAQRGAFEQWDAKNSGDSAAIAARHINERLAAYEKPDLDPAIEKDLKRFVAR